MFYLMILIIYFDSTELLLISREVLRDLVDLVQDLGDNLILSDLDAGTQTLQPSPLSGWWGWGEFDLDASEKILQLDVEEFIPH